MLSKLFFYVIGNDVVQVINFNPLDIVLINNLLGDDEGVTIVEESNTATVRKVVYDHTLMIIVFNGCRVVYLFNFPRIRIG